MTMLATPYFEQYCARQVAANQPIVFDEMIFAKIDGLTADNLSSHLTMPSNTQIAHRATISRAGYIDDNKVVYSVMLGSDVGNFEFNFIGLINKSENKLAVALYTDLLTKRKNQGRYYGNAMTRNLILNFRGAKALTNITIPAESWQLDFTGDLLEIRQDFERFRLDLASPDGFKYIGQCESIAELRTIEPTQDQQRVLVKSYYEGKNKGGGVFYADFTDTTTTDNGGTVIVTARGKRWKRVVADTLYFSDFGIQAGKDVAAETTAKINACFKFAYENHIGNVVNDYAGDYYINSFINIGDNLTFKNVEGVRYLRNKYTAMLYNGLSIKPDSSGDNPAKNIHIIGGEFDSNAEEQWSAVNFMSLGYIKGLHIEGVIFTNCIRNHAIDLSACSDVLIENCRFLGFNPDKTTRLGTAPDQGVESRNFSEAIQIDDNVQGTFSGGVLKGDPDYNVVIRNNVFSRNPNDTTGLFNKGYGCAVGGHYAARNVRHHNNIIIENNLIEDCIYAGIRPFLWDDVKIIGNTFKGNHRNIYIWWLADTGVNPSEAGKNYHITHNNFDDSVAQNILTQIFGNNYTGNFAYLENVLITNNKFGNTEWDGAVIHLQGVKNATVSNNLFDEAKRFVDIDYSRKVSVINNSGNNLENEFFASKNNLYANANIIGTTEDVHISGNFAKNCTGGVLYLQKMQNVVVTDNCFINVANTHNTNAFRAFEVNGLWCDNNVVRLSQSAVNANVRALEVTSSCSDVSIGSFMTNSLETYKNSSANLSGVNFSTVNADRVNSNALIVGKENSSARNFLVNGSALMTGGLTVGDDDEVGKISFLTKGYAQAQTPVENDNSMRLATTEWVRRFAALSGLLSANGWTKFANGLIIQWGTYNANAQGVFNFPIAFTRECFVVLPVDYNSTGQNLVTITGTNKTAESFQIQAEGGDVGLFSMVAIGV